MIEKNSKFCWGRQKMGNQWCPSLACLIHQKPATRTVLYEWHNDKNDTNELNKYVIKFPELYYLTILRRDCFGELFVDLYIFISNKIMNIYDEISCFEFPNLIEGYACLGNHDMENYIPIDSTIKDWIDLIKEEISLFWGTTFNAGAIGTFTIINDANKTYLERLSNHFDPKIIFSTSINDIIGVDFESVLFEANLTNWLSFEEMAGQHALFSA